MLPCASINFLLPSEVTAANWPMKQGRQQGEEYRSSSLMDHSGRLVVLAQVTGAYNTRMRKISGTEHLMVFEFEVKWIKWLVCRISFQNLDSDGRLAVIIASASHCHVCFVLYIHYICMLLPVSIKSGIWDQLLEAPNNWTCLLQFFSHLMGLFYRTIRMVENGIKPV